MPSTEEHKVFNRLQKAVRKDVERLFGVLTQHFHIALHPGRYRSVKMLILTFKAICILHNMCVESRREGFLSRHRRAEGACRITRPSPRPLAGPEVVGAPDDANDVSSPGSDRWRYRCWVGS